ncbi:hypothetical protein D3C77_467350 [compost metagenome]
MGRARIATQVHTNAGDADDVLVTPKKLRWGFSYSFGLNGYVVLPSWMAGLIFQWGQATLVMDDQSVPFPLAYPNVALNVQTTCSGFVERITGAAGLSKTGFAAEGFSMGGSSGAPGSNWVVANGNISIFWFSVGY